jgi:hypothetical protein
MYHNDDHDKSMTPGPTKVYASLAFEEHEVVQRAVYLAGIAKMQDHVCVSAELMARLADKIESATRNYDYYRARFIDANAEIKKLKAKIVELKRNAKGGDLDF